MTKKDRASYSRSLSRRDFLRAGLGSALGLSAVSSLYLIGCGQTAAPASPKPSTAPSSAAASQAAGAAKPDPGVEREKLLEAARKEGTVLWYSSAVADWGAALIKAFNAKYPGIKIEHYRANNEEIRERAITEWKAGRPEYDVVEGSGDDHYYYLQTGMFKKHTWPDAASYKPEFRNPDGYWLSTRWVPQVPAYNTKLVSAAEAPKTWEDLADPKWQGKLAIEEDCITWMEGITQYMGQSKATEYLRKLGAMKPRLGKGHATLTNLLGAGEFSVLITTYPNLVEGPKAKGAPVDWVRVNPTLIQPVMGVGISAKAPHPNAAIVWAEWMTSNDGQLAQARIGNPPAKGDVPGLPDSIKEQVNLKILSVPADWVTRQEATRQAFQEIFWPKKS